MKLFECESTFALPRLDLPARSTIEILPPALDAWVTVILRRWCYLERSSRKVREPSSQVVTGNIDWAVAKGIAECVYVTGLLCFITLTY
jgi:hypothetical protein